MSADETEDNKDKVSYKNQIEQKLEKARFRYNLFRCERTFLTVLTIGLTVALVTLITRRFVEVPPYTYTIIISLFSIYFLVNLYNVVFRWMGKSDAASILDKKMGFKERLVTGLEYAEQDENNKFLALLVDEINRKLDDKSIKESIPHKFAWSTKYLIAVLILFLIFLFLPFWRLVVQFFGCFLLLKDLFLKINNCNLDVSLEIFLVFLIIFLRL